MFFTKKTEKRIAKATLALYALSTIGVFGLGGATASAAEAPVCTTIDLGSSIATKSAGYTETNPSASPLSAALYAHPFAAIVAPTWVCCIPIIRIYPFIHTSPWVFVISKRRSS